MEECFSCSYKIQLDWYLPFSEWEEKILKNPQFSE